jgi:hypothetical protein
MNIFSDASSNLNDQGCRLSPEGVREATLKIFSKLIINHYIVGH